LSQEKKRDLRSFGDVSRQALAEQIEDAVDRLSGDREFFGDFGDAESLEPLFQDVGMQLG